MSAAWSTFIIVLVVANIVGCAWLLWGNRHVEIDPGEIGESTGHDFDGIEELNNPLPAWWTWLFIGTIVFGVGYFILYPGFGSMPGVLGWSSTGEAAANGAAAEAKYGPIYEAYLAQPIPDLLDDERALGMGRRIFANRCAQCHGSDARGGRGYPNLTDDDWIHGGAPETIVSTIANGRVGVMPPLGGALGGDEGVGNVTEHVLSLSGRDHDAAAAAIGKPMYDGLCGICHGVDGRGNQAIGAPNLSDDVWLHGGTRDDIAYAIEAGLNNQMPAHSDILTEGRVHVTAAYVLSLSKGGAAAP
ncbi:MAG: cytochrome-c oxidase, cbb3-type subunit III [bacterium]|nr:cytochrome-c oxidase, cbb3-type subunit III [bacterium]